MLPWTRHLLSQRQTLSGCLLSSLSRLSSSASPALRTPSGSVTNHLLSTPLIMAGRLLGQLSRQHQMHHRSILRASSSIPPGRSLHGHAIVTASCTVAAPHSGSSRRQAAVVRQCSSGAGRSSCAGDSEVRLHTNNPASQALRASLPQISNLAGDTGSTSNIPDAPSRCSDSAASLGFNSDSISACGNASSTGGLSAITHLPDGIVHSAGLTVAPPPNLAPPAGAFPSIASRLAGSNITRSYSQHIKGDRSLLSALLTKPEEFAKDAAVLDSIIKIYTVHSRPNSFLPWQNHPKRDSTGTGFIVHNRLILTNAHVVADSTYVLVKRHGSGTKFRADVQAVGHDCDLALLSVEDEAFWSSPTDMLPLELGSLPSLQQNVVVVGYPTGGDNTSVTSGVVSRVEVAQYVHAASYLMAIQIDAAINPGNSGGPALDNDKVVVGVAFQNLPQAENIGYIIPTTVVNRFLEEVANAGTYLGYCSLGVMCQNLENPHLRAALGMSSGQSGILVNSVQPTSTTARVLKKGDVLLEFDDVPIANDGTVHLRHRERIYFSSLITLKPTGATATLKVLRNGQPLLLHLTVQPNDVLVPVHQYDRLPSFYIFAGLVFVPLSQPFLHEYGGDGGDWVNAAPRRLYDKAMHSMLQKPGQQVVIVSQVLADDVNTGYAQFQTLQVLKVNGVEVLNLRHLKALVEGAGQQHTQITDGGGNGAARNANGNGTAAAHANGNGHSSLDVNENGKTNGHSGSGVDGSGAELETEINESVAAHGGAIGGADAAAAGLSLAAVEKAAAVAVTGEVSAGYVHFTLEDDRVMVIDKALAAVAQQRIQERYRVPAAQSKDIEAGGHLA